MTSENIKQVISQPNPEDQIIGLYIVWVASVTINPHEFQAVLANRAVSNWFMMEFNKHHQKYNEFVAYYKSSFPSDDCNYQALYEECLLPIFNLRPLAILKKAKPINNLSFAFLKYN